LIAEILLISAIPAILSIPAIDNLVYFEISILQFIVKCFEPKQAICFINVVILWNCYQSIYMVFIDYFTLNIIKLDRRNNGRIKDR
jgi:hypothetical protein